MKSLILKFLKLLKCYKKEINNLKLFILLIINCYFFYIIWSIIIDQDSNIINNNTILNSLSLYVKPLLDDLNIIVSLNIVNMLIITIIFVLINMLIFKLNKIFGIIGLGVSARLGYKTYKDYLNNLNELNIIGFEKKVEEVSDESAQIQIMEQIENTTPKEEVIPVVLIWDWQLIMGVTLLVISGVVIIYCYCKSDSNSTNSTTQNTNQEILQAEHININNLDASMTDLLEELKASVIDIFDEMIR